MVSDFELKKTDLTLFTSPNKLLYNQPFTGLVQALRLFLASMIEPDPLNFEPTQNVSKKSKFNCAYCEHIYHKVPLDLKTVLMEKCRHRKSCEQN